MPSPRPSRRARRVTRPSCTSTGKRPGSSAFTPSVEIASDRSSLVTGPTSTLLLPTPRPNYVNIGSYALVNLEAAYAFTDGITLNVGATNLLDEDYALAEGFPEPGRTFFANLRARF